MGRQRYSQPSDWLRQAELAMGSSHRALQSWQMAKRFGAHIYWTPDQAQREAANSDNVRKLIWC